MTTYAVLVGNANNFTLIFCRAGHVLDRFFVVSYSSFFFAFMYSNRIFIQELQALYFCSSVEFTRIESPLHRGSQKKLPREIGDMKNLESLDVRNSRILPEEIFQLTQLKKLYLLSNQLKPADIFHFFTRLEVLFMEYMTTPISNDFPSEIRNLNQLEVLSLKGNRIAKLSNEIGKLTI